MNRWGFFAILAIAFSATVLSCCSQAYADAFTWGDLSTAPGATPNVACNGSPGGQDAALVLKYYAGVIDSLASCPDATVYTNPAFPPGSDVNGDGKLGGQDAATILKHYAGLITCLSADTNCDGAGPEAGEGEGEGEGEQYTLTYTAGTNGTITGTSPQTVSHGTDGTPVTAVADEGYHFVDWSDGSTANPRTDTNVAADITVTANFVSNYYPTPGDSQIQGRIEVASGTPLDPTGFALVSAGGAVLLNVSWEFTEMPVWANDAGQFLFVEDLAGNSILMMYVKPEETNAPPPLVLTTTHMALGLLAMHPACFSLDDAQRRELLAIAEAHADFPDLILLIAQALQTAPTLLSDYDTFPAIHELAAAIGNDAAKQWQDSRVPGKTAPSEKSDVGNANDPHLDDWVGNGVTLVNTHLLFYGVEWGEGNDQWTLIRGRDAITQLIPPAWTPNVEKRVALADGNYTVEFWKGQGGAWSENHAEQAGARANIFKTILLGADTLAPPFYNIATGTFNNNALIEWFASNPSEDSDAIISFFEDISLSSSDTYIGALKKIVAKLSNNGVYEGSLTQKIAHLFYNATDTDGRTLWRHFKNANTWLDTAVKVLKFYDIANEFAPYFGQTFLYRNHYLYDIGVSGGVLTEGFSLIPPDARLTASTSQPTIGQTVTFNASGTTDDIDPLSALSFRFDFEADGVWDTSWTQGAAIQSHAYTATGAKVCVVEVMDSDGLVGQASYSLYINGAGTGAVSIDVTPNNGQWRLLGPPGFAAVTGSGDRTGGSAIVDAPVGAYTLLCYDNVAGYYPPAMPTQTLGAGGTISFTATWMPESTATEETIMLPGNVPLVLVRIQAGTFMMGATANEQDSWDSEPQHQVTLTQAFWLGKYELTKRQWTAVMGTTPWSGLSSVLDDPDSPAVDISWNDCQAFITAVNALGKGTFGFPTEAQWEYACRAGTTTRFYWGDDPSYTEIGNYAWYDGNALSVGEQYAHIVGKKQPNAWGLYDMSGNVWEWCQDWWSYYSADVVLDPQGPSTGSFRVTRGGGWAYHGFYYCRSGRRQYMSPDGRDSDVGFRLCAAGLSH